MSDFSNPNSIDFKVDIQNLYREEAVTDLKVASIRRLVPIRPDGSDDTTRNAIFIASTQLMSPEGPLPLQARLQANNLSEAYEEFPKAMQQALNEVMAQVEEMRRQQAAEKKDESRIIVPGR